MATSGKSMAGAKTRRTAAGRKAPAKRSAAKAASENAAARTTRAGAPSKRGKAAPSKAAAGAPKRSTRTAAPAKRGKGGTAAKASAAKVRARADAAPKTPTPAETTPPSGVERVGEAMVTLGSAALAVTAAAVAEVLGAATRKSAEPPAGDRDADEQEKAPGRD